MAQVGLKRAAELTGKSQSTIHRAAEAGKLAFIRTEAGERVFDVSELDRVYGLLPQGEAGGDTGGTLREVVPDMPRNSVDAPRNVAVEVELAVLKAKLEAANDTIGRLERDRDSWRNQATQALALLPKPADTPPTPAAPRGLLARLFGR